MTANVRFWFDANDPSDLGERYLEAIQLVARVRINSLYPTSVTAPRWQKVAHLFQTEVGDRYVNIVCAYPARRAYPVRGAAAADRVDVSVFEMYAAAEAAANIAITYAAQPDALPDDAAMALAGRYDAVFTPTEASLDILRRAGVMALHGSPMRIADRIYPYLRAVP